MQVSFSTVNRYIDQYRQMGHVQPKVQARQQPRLRDDPLPLLEQQLAQAPNATLTQQVATWEAEQGVRMSVSTIVAGTRAGRMDAKKTVGATERDEVERLLFADLACTLPVDHLVVVDESGSHLGMTPAYAHAPRGERAYAQARRNYGDNLSFISALRVSGMTAALVIKGAVDSAVFETYGRDVLAPPCDQVTS